MAKELPYFKFEPGAWDTGNIQMCSRDSKGLFVDICSLYWSRLGEVPYALALQKLCNGSKDALQELVNHEIIGIVDGQIIVEFLDEQLAEFLETSEKRRFAANKRWKDASALHVESKSNAIREEKKREEKIREEENAPVDFDLKFLQAFDSNTCDGYKLAFRNLDLGRELQEFRLKCDNDKKSYYHRDSAGLRTAFQYQLKNSRNGKSGKGFTDKREQQSVDRKSAFANRVNARSTGEQL